MRNQKGFTLIELLIVILIIGILLALIVPNFSIVQDRARQVNVKNNMRIIEVAIGSYSVDHMAAYPADLDGLEPYLPGGDPDVGDAGVYPTNPYSGVAYNAVDEDLFYDPAEWDDLGYQIADENGGAVLECPYVDYIGDAYGQINIGGYDPLGTGIPVGFSIYGWGRYMDDPLRTSGTITETNRVYFIYYQ